MLTNLQRNFNQRTLMNQTIQQVYNKRFLSQKESKIKEKREASKKLVERCFKHTTSHARPYPNILDLGCGTGTRTYWFPNYTKEVLALDISEVGISLARKINRHPAISYKIADVNKIQLDKKFSCITSFGLSVTNLNDITETSKIILKFLERFGAKKVTYIHYSKTDFSGCNPGWKYHSHMELNEMISLLQKDKKINHQKLIIFLPHGLDISYTHFLGNMLIHLFELVYRLVRRQRYRFAFIIILDAQNP